MIIEEMREIIADVKFPEYEFFVGQSAHGFIYLQAEYDEADTVTGIVERQHTRRWALSPEMTKSEVVSTAFKCVLTSMEHRTREWFLYKDKPVFHPHYNIDDLLSICESRSVRK